MPWGFIFACLALIAVAVLVFRKLRNWNQLGWMLPSLWLLAVMASVIWVSLLTQEFSGALVAAATMYVTFAFGFWMLFPVLWISVDSYLQVRPRP